MKDSFEFTLHSHLTKEDWDKISDVEHENTKSVIFQTPQGRQVRYIKCEALDKIRAEIEHEREEAYIMFGHALGYDKIAAYDKCIGIIDKYKKEVEDKE